MLSLLQNQYRTDGRRAVRIALIALGVSLLWVPALWMAAGEKPVGEMAAVAAIPLIVSYVLLRAIGQFVSVSERDRAESEDGVKVVVHGGLALLFGLAALIFVFGVWTFAISGLSLLAYEALGIEWAANGAGVVILLTLRVVAGIAITICTLILCKEWIGRIAKVSHEIVNHPINHGAHQH
jgi:hypothetical protein